MKSPLKITGSISKKDSWWLYEEEYRVNEGYEFHVLLDPPAEGLMDLIITAEKLSFRKL